MRLKALHAENFRALEKMEIDFQPMTVLIGENDVGKTSCMLAIRLIFEVKKLEDPNDFFKRLTDREVIIEAKFEAKEPTPTQAKYCCDSAGRVRLRCVYPFGEPRRVSARRLLPKDSSLRDISNMSVGEMRQKLVDLGLIASSEKPLKAQATEILERHISNLDTDELEEAWITISETELASVLPEFVLVPVGRLLDSSLRMADNSLLGRLFRPLLRSALDKIAEANGLGTVRQTLKECVQTRVGDLQQLLREQMNNSTVALTHQVDFDPMKGLSFGFGMDDERVSGIPIENRGAGVHNNLTLAMFRLLAQYGTENFILAIEEPENSLHPRGQREMLWALQDVADRGQVICTTHSPVFLDLGRLENNVVLTRTAAGNTIARTFRATSDELRDLRELLGVRLSDALLSGGGNCALIVEGPTELHAYPHFFAMLGHNARALGVSIISVGGSDKHLIGHHLRVLRAYDIPAVVVLDSDAQKTYDDLSKYGQGGEFPNLRTVHLLSKGTFETYVPLDIAIDVINDHYGGEPVVAADIDESKDRIGEFSRVIYQKKGLSARFEHFKVQFGQLVGAKMAERGSRLDAEIVDVIDSVRAIAVESL
jgi:putative ATP-dependent endonuclease of OLD family